MDSHNYQQAIDRCDGELIEWRLAKQFLVDLIETYEADISEGEKRRELLVEMKRAAVYSESRKRKKR